MTENLDVQQTAQRLMDADQILILCHKNPDGDTVGSGSALYHALTALGKTAAVLCSDAIPVNYAYTAARMYAGEFVPQLTVAVDVAGIQLFGENNHMPEYSRHVDLCIDHHAGNSGYADFTLLDGSAAAAAELLYYVIEALGVEITPLIADCLYTGLATDTGCFKFACTTARTHYVAAKLSEAGAHLEELNTRLFESKSRERMEAERIARDHLEYFLDGRCALIYLTRDEIAASGAEPAELEELTGLPISIRGVDVGLTLRQQPGGSYRISVRTDHGVDACAIAKRLGGGGHSRAAGCELLGNLENTKSAILAEVEAELAAYDAAQRAELND
jgi:phosphoesterase RecJ-like protein